MKKYVLLFISSILLLSSISLVISRIIVPTVKNKKYKESIVYYNYDELEKEKEKKNDNIDETPVILLSGKDNEVAQLIVGTFINDLSAQQYEKAYNMLAKSFKDNNFKTFEEFNKYMNENDKGYLNVKYEKFDRINDVILCEVIIRDYKGKYEPIKKIFSIIKEDGEYKLSFSIGAENE